MSSYQVDPLRKFEIQGQVSPLLTAPKAAVAATANQQIVAAVTGKIIRVMGWIVQSGGAADSYWNLKSNSGGSAISGFLYAPATTDPADKLPIVDSGYMETSTGHGLFVDVAGGVSGVNFTIFYITYKPA